MRQKAMKDRITSNEDHNMCKLLIQLGLFTVVLLETASSVSITAPSHYVAFTGTGIKVEYWDMNLTQALAELVDISTGHVISQSTLPVDYPNAAFKIECGGIDYAGRFQVRIIDRAAPGHKIVVQTEPIEVRWPHIVLQIPPALETLSGNIKINFEIRDRVECSSINASTAYTIELVMYRDAEDLSEHEVIHKVNMSTFNNLALESNRITMDCALFDQKGLYEVRFYSSQGPQELISQSNHMNVTWNKMYAVSTQGDHIFPCDEYFLVIYQQPRCAGAEDKIRLYEKQYPVAGPSIEKYKTEHRAMRGDSVVRFKCDVFDDEVMEYCFKYVSFATSGLAHEHDMHCVPTKYSPVLAVDGGWTAWSNWTSCTSNCEGGTRTRHRACDNPPPSFNGKNCEGLPAESETCGTKCAVATTLSPFRRFTPDPDCPCGCQLTGSRGNIASSSVCRGSSIWKIQAPQGHAIRLTFLYYNLKKDNAATRIQIRDGDSLRDALLFDEFGGHELPPEIESQQNKMLIELQQGSSGEYSASDEGFALSYLSSVIAGPGAVDNVDSTIWSSAIIVIALLLFVAIVIAIVAFVCYHRYNIRKKDKERQQLGNQALLVNGEAPPTSPSHSQSQSISSVRGSTNISFGDPVTSPSHKSGKKRDFVLPKTSPTSPTRVRDIKLKHKRTRSSLKGSKGVSSSPPSSPSKHKVGPHVYSSPRAAHRENKDTNGAGQTPTSVYSISSHGYIPVSTLGSPANPPREKSVGITGSPLATRGDARNKSFLSAINKNPQAAPLAGDEQLSPTTPTGGLPPSYSTYLDRSTGQAPYSNNGMQESIPMDEYYGKTNPPDTYDMGRVGETGMYSPHTAKRHAAESPRDVPEKRPPVEGRDSLTRKKAEHPPVYETVQSRHPPSHGVVTHPDIHRTNFHPQDGGVGNYPHSRPEIKPLPLRSVQRPDGQSPDNNNKEDDKNKVKTPNSCVSSEVSPIFKQAPLFPESKSNSTMDLDMPGDNDFEYDDYVPELPGSYFSMDPHAYTLTWSQQPKWGDHKQEQQQPAGGQTNGKNGSSQC